MSSLFTLATKYAIADLPCETHMIGTRGIATTKIVIKVNTMKTGQKEGEDAEGEDQRWLSSHRQGKLERLEEEVKLLEVELENERNQRKALEESLRIREDAPLILALSEASEAPQTYPCIAGVEDLSGGAVKSPRLPDEGLTSTGTACTRATNEAIGGASATESSFLDEKLALANRGPKRSAAGVIDGTSSGQDTTFLDEKTLISERGHRKKVAISNRVANHASRSGSFTVLKRVIHNRRPDEGRSNLKSSDLSMRSGAGNIDSNVPYPGEGDMKQLQSEPAEWINLESGSEAMKVPTVTPGAVAVPGRSISSPRVLQVDNVGIALPAVNDEEDQALVADLVDEPGIALPVDSKRRRRMIVCGAVILTAVVATITSVSVVYIRPDAKSAPTPTPTTSLDPSTSPSSIPSMSPSTTLFGFLAENSFDRGIALSSEGSPQQKAMDWLVTKSGSSTRNYALLQSYVLATLYYATTGNRWASTVFYRLQRLTGSLDPSIDFSKDWLNTNISSCKWQGVSCNQDGEITSLQLSGNNLFGSIPAELAILDQSLSKFRDNMLFLPFLSLRN